MDLNKVAIAGRLCRDPELKFTPNGTAVAQASIAINRRWSSEGGEKKEEVTFVDVELWGKTAESFAKYLGKGKPCYIEGRLKVESWDDKTTGKKRSKMLVVAESWQFTDSKGEGHEPRAPKASEYPAASTRAPKPADPLNGESPDDDVPF